jgi:hypothetical protein
MFAKNQKQPLMVVVDNGRYNAYSLNPVPTKRDKWLFATLVGMGGVNESVETGTYHFNVKRVGFLQNEITLSPS